MLKLAIGFFIAAIAAGALGFGGWAGAFTGIAVLAFYLFVALTVLALLAGLLSSLGHTPGGAMGMLVVAALFGAGVYYWVDHDMSGEKVGRSVDRAAFELKEGAGDVVRTAGRETGRLVSRTADEADNSTRRAEREAEQDR
jgi:uncharacterized membrane protein YtjA (UPF0391 family)